jgi:hypothetical protein
VLIALGIVGVLLAWRQQRGAAMALVLAAIGGFVAWPYVAAAALYLAAALVSLGNTALQRESDLLLRSALGVAALLVLATVTLLLLHSFSYPLFGALAALATFVAATVELKRSPYARPTSARP